MTAIITRPLSDSTDSLLRFAMRVDATVCGAAGLLIAVTAEPLARLTGLSATAEWITGAGLVAYGAALYMLAAVHGLRGVGIVLVAANTIFAVATTAVLAAGLLPLTGAGVALTFAFAVVTAALAWLQYLGVRRLA